MNYINTFPNFMMLRYLLLWLLRCHHQRIMIMFFVWSILMDNCDSQLHKILKRVYVSNPLNQSSQASKFIVSILSNPSILKVKQRALVLWWHNWLSVNHHPCYCHACSKSRWSSFRFLRWFAAEGVCWSLGGAGLTHCQ